MVIRLEVNLAKLLSTLGADWDSLGSLLGDLRDSSTNTEMRNDNKDAPRQSPEVRSHR